MKWSATTCYTKRWHRVRDYFGHSFVQKYKALNVLFKVLALSNDLQLGRSLKKVIEKCAI